jgi:UDP-glucose 4-epimerase
MPEGSRSSLLMTGGAGLTGQHAVRALLDMAAAIVDISAARALGYQPAHDLKAGIATVWPEFSETAK